MEKYVGASASYKDLTPDSLLPSKEQLTFHRYGEQVYDNCIIISGGFERWHVYGMAKTMQERSQLADALKSDFIFMSPALNEPSVDDYYPNKHNLRSRQLYDIVNHLSGNYRTVSLYGESFAGAEFLHLLQNRIDETIHIANLFLVASPINNTSYRVNDAQRFLGNYQAEISDAATTRLSRLKENDTLPSQTHLSINKIVYFNTGRQDPLVDQGKALHNLTEQLSKNEVHEVEVEAKEDDGHLPSERGRTTILQYMSTLM